MAERYGLTAQENAVTTGLTTIGALIRGAGRRGNIADVILSAGGTPADNVLRFVLQRFTVAPTVSAVVPAPTQGGGPASFATAGENASAEGTYTAATELFDEDVNQRATFRQVFAPGYELQWPDVAANGIGLRVSSPAYTGPANGTQFFEE